MSPSIFDFAITMINKNPNIANSPMGKNALEALRNRDATKGEELANNILESQGLTKDSALQDIKSRMPNIPFL